MSCQEVGFRAREGGPRRPGISLEKLSEREAAAMLTMLVLSPLPRLFETPR